jgi:hypothetical protein
LRTKSTEFSLVFDVFVESVAAVGDCLGFFTLLEGSISLKQQGLIGETAFEESDVLCYEMANRLYVYVASADPRLPFLGLIS